MKLSADWLEVLRCPHCRGLFREEKQALCCLSCGRRYPVREGLPDLVPESGKLPGRRHPDH